MLSPGQLCRVSYRRPESWNWLFAARILDAPNAPGGGVAAIIIYDLTVGIGRSQITIPAFEQFEFVWSGVQTFPTFSMYSTSSYGPNRVQGAGAAATRDNFIDRITAQDIQLACRVLYSDADATRSATVEVSAHFAPAVHVRPEWASERFPGGEES